MPNDFYTRTWDAEIGLWAKDDAQGHADGPARLHEIRANAWMLLAAGCDDLLDRVATGRVLRALRAAQYETGPKRGCFRWNWEDTQASDPNSGFFTTLALLIFRHEFGARLSDPDRAVLDTLLREATHWFAHETAAFNDAILRYPNKSLGDAVCRYLLAELAGPPAPDDRAILERALTYYRDREWGWGEHLSDLYGKICQDELAALLLYARQLPAAQRAQAVALLQELADIDARFAGGPRVPAIRSYYFDGSPRRPDHAPAEAQPYRDVVAGVWDPAHPRGGTRAMRSLFGRRGLAAMLSPSPAAAERCAVPCHGGAVARAIIHADVRLGALSRWPFMADLDHEAWGLSWQTMPVAFWHRRGDWGFLQWEIEDGSGRRAYPANRRQERECLLGQPQGQLASPETFSMDLPDGFVVVRRAPAWTDLADRWRLIDATGRRPAEGTEGRWRRLSLAWPDPARMLILWFCPLVGAVKTALRDNPARGYDWNHHYERAEDETAQVCGLWVFRLGEGPMPDLAKEGAAWTLRVDGAQTFRIDPVAAEPLSATPHHSS